MDSTDEQRVDFGRALRRRLDDLGHSRAWLGAEVARHEKGEGAKPYTASAVTMWVNGDTEPTRPKVWAIEAALGARPGTLSSLLGYRPVEGDAATGVLGAIDDDPRLDAEGRRVLTALYLVLTGVDPARVASGPDADADVGA